MSGCLLVPAAQARPGGKRWVLPVAHVPASGGRLSEQVLAIDRRHLERHREVAYSASIVSIVVQRPGSALAKTSRATLHLESGSSGL